jgi:hypothetical protein
MNSRSRAATTAQGARNVLRLGVLQAVLLGLACGRPQVAAAQDVPAFAPGMISHMQKMEQFKDADHGAQPPPPVIPRFEIAPDPSGAIATFAHHRDFRKLTKSVFS